MRTSTSPVVLSERTSPVLMAIVAPFFELRSRFTASSHSARLEDISIHADGGSSEREADQHQSSGWQGGFLVPCLERGESQ